MQSRRYRTASGRSFVVRFGRQPGAVLTARIEEAGGLTPIATLTATTRAELVAACEEQIVAIGGQLVGGTRLRGWGIGDGG